MARDGSGIYSKPAGTTAVSGTTIESAKYNTLMDDIEADLNTDRPIVAGGTGESTVGAMRDAFEIDAKMQTKSGAYTALAADRSTTIRSTATMTLTLTLAATLGDGWFINVIADTGTLTIDGAGSETIDGSTTLVLTVGQKATIICDGTSFYTLNALTAVEMAQLQAIGAVTISSGQWTYLGAMNQALATTDSVDFAAIDGPIGGGTPAAGTFTSLNATTGGALTGTWSDLGTVTTVDIDGGTIDGTAIGGSTPAAGDFTTVSASGIADFADGAEATPSITNTGDLNTGMWFPAADTIAWSVAAGEVVRIDSVGKVGIGETTPLDEIHITVGSPAIRLEDTTDSSYSTIGYNGGTLAIGVDDGNAAATSAIKLFVDGSEKARLEADGAFLVGTTVDGSAGAGDIVANGGIYLGGSAAANYLDDYEEGSWTPIITFGAGSVGMTLTTQVGRYTKVGNLVTVSGRIAMSVVGSSTGNAFMEGLPFTSANVTDQKAAGSVNFSAISFADMMTCKINENESKIGLQENLNDGTVDNINHANFSSTSTLTISISYRV